MSAVKVKIRSVCVECSHCGYDQVIDISDYEETHFKEFVEYNTTCDNCSESYDFALDVN